MPTGEYIDIFDKISSIFLDTQDDICKSLNIRQDEFDNIAVIFLEIQTTYFFVDILSYLTVKSNSIYRYMKEIYKNITDPRQTNTRHDKSQTDKH